MYRFEHTTLEDRLMELLMLSGRKVILHVDAALQEVNLSGPKLWALQQLIESETPLGVSQLAQCLRAGKSNITQLLDRMESEHLVRRVPNPDDRRSVLIEVTAEGRQRFEAGQRIHRETVHSLLSVLTQDDKQALINRLEKFVTSD